MRGDELAFRDGAAVVEAIGPGWAVVKYDDGRRLLADDNDKELLSRLVPQPVPPPSWPDGYFPLWCVITDKAGDGDITIRGGHAIDYFTHETITSLKPGAIRLLVKAGDYTFEYDDGTGVKYENATIIDPLGSNLKTEKFRDGKPIWFRGGPSDRFIMAEKPYSHLHIEGTVLDLGAHIGTFTRDALAAGATRVIAYEPEPFNFRLLERNTEGMPVERHRAAAAGYDLDDNGVVLQLSWTESGRGSSANTLTGKSRNRPSITVPAEHVLDIVDRVQPDTLKADIKGVEEKVNWARLKDSPVKNVAIESSRAFLMNVITPTLESSGFTRVWIPENRRWRRDVGFWRR